MPSIERPKTMQINLTYHHLTHHIVPGPQSFSYFIPLLLLPTALLIPRTVLSKWQNAAIFIPIMTISTMHAWYIMNGTDVISADVLFQALFFLVFQDPWGRYEYVPPPTDERGKVPSGSSPLTATGKDLDPSRRDLPDDDIDERSPLKPSISDFDNTPSPPHMPHGQRYPPSLATRISWVLTLLSSIRLNNWRIGHTSHDTAQPPAPAFRSRKHFLLQSLISALRGYIVLDLTRAYVDYDEYFTSTSIPMTSPLPFDSGSSMPATAQFVRTMIIGAQAWALISQMFYAPAILPVIFNALGLLPDTWSPHNWVPFFGPARTIFTSGVRGFWGGYWHQTMRWMTSGPAYFLCDKLGLEGGGLARYAIISCSAFLLSGITHMGLVPPEPLHASVSANSIRMYVAAFFWLQPVAMMIEVIVAKLAVRVLPLKVLLSPQLRVVRAVVNGVWVLAWFTLCITLLGEAGRQLGYWRVWPMPVSVWRGLRGEGWVTWPFLLS